MKLIKACLRKKPRRKNEQNIRAEPWQRRQLDWIGEQLGVQRQEDWYYITGEDVKQVGGGSNLLCEHYNNSYFTCLKTVYPEFEWNPSQFVGIPHQISHPKPRHYWTEKMNRRAFMDSVAEQLGIKTLEDWYTVQTRQVASCGGDQLLKNYFNNSLFATLKSVYDEFEWNPLLFKSAPLYYWNILDNQTVRDTVNHILQDLGPKHLQDVSMIRTLNRITRHFGGIRRALDILQIAEFPGTVGERSLASMLKVVSKIERERIVHGVSVDIYLPTISVAFEFQGPHHYVQTHHGSFTLRKQRDQRKREVLREKGITLVEVPYWWKGNMSSLLATFRAKLQQRASTFTDSNVVYKQIA